MQSLPLLSRRGEPPMFLPRANPLENCNAVIHDILPRQSRPLSIPRLSAPWTCPQCKNPDCLFGWGKMSHGPRPNRDEPNRITTLQFSNRQPEPSSQNASGRSRRRAVQKPLSTSRSRKTLSSPMNNGSCTAILGNGCVGVSLKMGFRIHCWADGVTKSLGRPCS